MTEMTHFALNSKDGNAQCSPGGFGRPPRAVFPLESLVKGRWGYNRYGAKEYTGDVDRVTCPKCREWYFARQEGTARFTEKIKSGEVTFLRLG